MEPRSTITLFVYLSCVIFVRCTEDIRYYRSISNGECFQTADTKLPQIEYDEYGYILSPSHPPITKSITVKCSFFSGSFNGGSLPDVSSSEPTYCSQSQCSRSLIITNSKIPDIPPSAFIKYKETTLMDINGIGLEKILPGAFNTLNSLMEINLSDNKLTCISDGVFNSLDKLRVLDLSRNSITNLSTHSFTGAISLEILNLSLNALETIDSLSFIHMKQLKELDLSFNRLQRFNFFLISNIVQNLNLSSNIIASVTGCFGVMKNVNLSKNLLTTLQNSSCNDDNSNIDTLDLSDNMLSNLGDVSEMSNLRYLYLQNNSIVFLSNIFFSKLNELLVLNVSSNRLEQFQYGLFDALSSLTTLDVSHNRLTSLKKFNYHLLKNLQVLYINNNQLRTFDSEDFVTILTKLKVISLEGNNFTCDTLLQIFHHLRDVTIIRGHSFNTSNIHGIACSESISSPQPDLDIRVTSGETLEKSLNNDFTKSSMYRYFNSDLKNSSFFRYLENFKYVGSLVTNYSKVLDNVKNIQKLQDDFNKSIQGYFNNSFLNSSFVRYLENFKKNEDALNENFTQSFMYNYFNKNFISSSFYKYLEGLKKPQFIVKYSGDVNNTKVEKLVGTLTNAEDTKDDSALLVVIVVLLVVIACIMLGAMYAILFKFGTLLKVKNEQVELLNT